MLARSEFDPSGAAVPRAVEEVFVRFGAVWRLAVGGRDVFTTPEHPFFEAAKGWVPCQELAAGDRLLCRDGSWVAVGAVEDTGRWETVYNFRIAEDHTYFVGCPEWGFGVWAHNSYLEFLRRIGGEDSRALQELYQRYINDINNPAADRLALYRRFYNDPVVDQALDNAHARSPLLSLRRDMKNHAWRSLRDDASSKALQIGVDMHHIEGVVRPINIYNNKLDPTVAILPDGKGGFVLQQPLASGAIHTYHSPAGSNLITPLAGGKGYQIMAGTGGHTTWTGRTKVIEVIPAKGALSHADAYAAHVEIADNLGNWIPKLSRDGTFGYTTMYPDNWPLLTLHLDVGQAFIYSGSPAHPPGGGGGGVQFRGNGHEVMVEGWTAPPPLQVRTGYPV